MLNEQSRMALEEFSRQDAIKIKEINHHNYLKFGPTKRTTEFLRERDKRQKEKFPEKILARKKLRNAVMLGKIKRPLICSRCPNLNPHGHHPDYSKPLEVIWLCRNCHNAEHQLLRIKELKPLLS